MGTVDLNTALRIILNGGKLKQIGFGSSKFKSTYIK
jgi:hypothetical protein